MYHALLSIIYIVDLALFVLVFLVVRSRRVSAGWMLTVVLASVAMYLASLVLLIYVSSHL